MNLDAVVREYLIEANETENKYFRFLQLAISALRELNMDVSGLPSIAILDVSSTDTVDLPPDYIKYVRIGVCDSAGNINILGENVNMCLNRGYDDCGNTESTTTQTTASGPGYSYGDGYSDNFRDGECTGRFFGIGGGNNANGYYRIDEERGLIQLGSITATQIVLEYLADLTAVDGEFQVHPYIVDCLKAGIFWRSIQRNRTFGLGEKSLAEQDYHKAYRLANKRFKASTIDEWIQSLRKGNKLAPKF